MHKDSNASLLLQKKEKKITLARLICYILAKIQFQGLDGHSEKHAWRQPPHLNLSSDEKKMGDRSTWLRWKNEGHYSLTAVHTEERSLPSVKSQPISQSNTLRDYNNFSATHSLLDYQVTSDFILPGLIQTYTFKKILLKLYLIASFTYCMYVCVTMHCTVLMQFKFLHERMGVNKCACRCL